MGHFAVQNYAAPHNFWDPALVGNSMNGARGKAKY